MGKSREVTGQNSRAGSALAENRKEHFGEQLAERFRMPLISFFMRRVSNRAEAEDLTQEVFVRVLRKANNSDISNVEAFLFSTATNLLRDRARRARIRLDYQQSVSLDANNRIEELSPERVTIGNDELQDVLDALAKMNEKTRDIFILRRLENLKVREIAEMYGISVSAIEKHMVRALTHLTKHLND